MNDYDLMQNTSGSKELGMDTFKTTISNEPAYSNPMPVQVNGEHSSGINFGDNSIVNSKVVSLLERLVWSFMTIGIIYYGNGE